MSASTVARWRSRAVSVRCSRGERPSTRARRQPRVWRTPRASRTGCRASPPEACRQAFQNSVAAFNNSARCARQFAYRPEQHETLLGLLPLASPTAQHILRQVRPWIEPAHSFEKNQLGLEKIFLNGLRFSWVMSLLADAAVLLRACALLRRPILRPLLAEFMPTQLSLELPIKNCETNSSDETSNQQNPQ